MILYILIALLMPLSWLILKKIWVDVLTKVALLVVPLAYGKTTTELYYNKLNEFEYKSSEISAIKDKLQEGLQLSIEAYDISSKVKFNDRGYPEDLEKWDELDELQQRMNQSADELNEDFKAVRLKLEKAAETAEEK